MCVCGGGGGGGGGGGVGRGEQQHDDFYSECSYESLFTI